MRLGIHDLTSSGWFQATAWSIGFPLITITVVLGGAALAQRYARTVAGVSEALSPFSKQWLIEHRRRNQVMAFAIYLIANIHTRVTDLLFMACISAFALYLGGWAVWCLVSGRAPDVASRVYCAGLFALAGFVFCVAILLYELNERPHHATPRTAAAITGSAADHHRLFTLRQVHGSLRLANCKFSGAT